MEQKIKTTFDAVAKPAVENDFGFGIHIGPHIDFPSGTISITPSIGFGWDL